MGKRASLDDLHGRVGAYARGPGRTVTIVGVLLAAGAGSRFGGDKLLALLPDGTSVGVTAARLLKSAVDEAVAVVRRGDMELTRLLSREGLRVLPFPGAAEGMGASLAFGVAATPDADGWVVALADMPFLGPESVAAVATSLRHGAWIAAPSFRGRRGHPVGFAKGLFVELTALRGDRGAREILVRHAGRIQVIDVDSPGILLDIDALDDLPQEGPGINKKLSS
jgi:molybdenum cofactor cytidylyltransferase